MSNFKILIFSLAIISLIFVSCKKDPGEGGLATINGKVVVYDFDNSFKQLRAIYEPVGLNVYISYGDIPGVGNSVKTAYNGTFQFAYLRKGKYTIYAESKDSSNVNSNKTIAIIRQVEITEKKQVIELPVIEVID